jgi:hypothetical protein
MAQKVLGCSSSWADRVGGFASPWHGVANVYVGCQTASQAAFVNGKHQ